MPFLSAPRGIAAIVLFTSLSAAQTPEPIRFARNAGIANDGRVAFTYQEVRDTMSIGDLRSALRAKGAPV